MKRLAPLLLTLLVFSTAPLWGGDAPAWLIVPSILPRPTPAPGAIPRLGTDDLYVVDAKEACFALASPDGLVVVSVDPGPLRIRGRFVGGKGVETRTFQGPTVIVVEAQGTGRAELIVVKAGAKSETDVFRQVLDVAGGPPEPKPPEPPGPKPPEPPVPPKPPAQQRLWLIVIEETGEATKGRGVFFADAALHQRIKDKGHRFRVVDKDVKDAGGQTPADVRPYVEHARSSSAKLPRLYLVTTAGDVLFAGDVPSTPAALVALLEKHGG